MPAIQLAAIVRQDLDLERKQQQTRGLQRSVASLAHVVNPVIVGESSDLFTAQPITFESMRLAKMMAGNDRSVSLFSVQYPEDVSIIPEFITGTPDLTRSIESLSEFKGRRKLPLLVDILGRLYEATDAEYLIYTNVDIALLPQFYLCVSSIINSGFDAFTINRRTISAHFKSISELPQMYSTIGSPHAGHDCFVFKRELFRKFELGNVCVGINWVGAVLLANLMVHAKKFMMFHDVHLTFHIGDEMTWKDDRNEEYRNYNRQQARKVRQVLDEKCGFPDREKYPALKTLDIA